MKYQIQFTAEAHKHFSFWEKSGQSKVLKKISAILHELSEHPETGTGKVEQLKGDLAGLWSRRIDKHNRIIYKIEENIVTITVVSMRGHYGDK